MIRINTSKASSLSHIPRPSSTSQTNTLLQFIRGKRTKRVITVSSSTQRIISQLSIISQRKKAPRLIKLSNEDLIRHDTVTRAWAVYQKDKRNLQQDQLSKQYDSIQFALNDLNEINPELYKIANKKEKGKRYPLDVRIPVDYPPNKIWYSNVTKDEK